MLKNIGSNWTLNLVQILVFMVLSPFVVNALGTDVNGVWVSIVSLTGFLQLLILGVPMASVRYIAEHVARKDTARTNEAISTCLAICLFMGGVALLVGGGMYLAFQTQYLASSDWAVLGPATLGDARVAFVVVVFTVTVGFAAQLPYGIYDAHHEFVQRNLIMGGSILFRLGLTVLLLSWRSALVSLALVQVGCMVSEFIIALWMVRRRHPELRFGLGAFDRKLVRAILSFSVFAMLLNVGSRLAFQTDALVIGWFTRPEQITIYDIGNKIFDPFTNLILGIGMVVMPTATALKARGEEAALRGVLLRWSKISFAIVVMIGTYLLILGPQFLSWWFGDQYVPESGRLLQVLMVSFLLFLPVRGVALPILMGLGKPHRPAIALLLMGLLNLVLSVVLIRDHGLVGVALGTAIPNVIFAVTVLRFACAEVGVGTGELAAYAFGRCLVGAIVPAAFLLGLEQWLEVSGFFPLFLAGIAFVAVFGATFVFFVFRGDPWIDLDARIIGRLRGRSADSA